MAAETEKATFAAGCFWGVEKSFWDLEGVMATRVGYTGGHTKNPTYEEICTGRTGYAEAVEVTYDPSKTRYEDLLEIFWTHHDSTQVNRQGPDVGTQYRSAIFYHHPEQKELAESTKTLLSQSGIFKKPVATEIAPVQEFYAAEEYHQKYLKKNPKGYCSLQLQPAKIREILRQARHV